MKTANTSAFFRESSLAMEAVSADSSDSEIKPDLDQQRKHSTTITTVITTPGNNETLDIFYRKCTKNVQTDIPKPCDTRTSNNGQEWLKLNRAIRTYSSPHSQH
eukprot:7099686-Ditylum_brightwellii.AAC.1